MSCRKTSAPTSISVRSARDACGVSDARFPEDDWRATARNLARWYERFRGRPSMRATKPGETPFDSFKLLPIEFPDRNPVTDLLRTVNSASYCD
jgi:hypothetical protein